HYIYPRHLGETRAQFKYIPSVVFKYIHNEIWNRNSFYVDTLIKLTNGKVYSYGKNVFNYSFLLPAG
ncbi:hypothetical protein ACLBP3_30610, partial [Klebsiella pneumoniae]|uniref:hypothetical protein n=1 Tax=Klebsiella pneumoniae TaxID=573 RepID=UPI00396C2922